MLFSKFLELVSALPFPVTVYQASIDDNVCFKTSESSYEYSPICYCFRIGGKTKEEQLHSLKDHLHTVFQNSNATGTIRRDLVVLVKGDSLVLSEEPQLEGSIYVAVAPDQDRHLEKLPYTKEGRLYPVNTVISSVGPGYDTIASSDTWKLQATLSFPAYKPVIQLTPDGEILWHGHVVETDDELRAAVLDIRNVLLDVKR